MHAELRSAYVHCTHPQLGRHEGANGRATSTVIPNSYFLRRERERERASYVRVYCAFSPSPSLPSYFLRKKERAGLHETFLPLLPPSGSQRRKERGWGEIRLFSLFRVERKRRMGRERSDIYGGREGEE